MPCFAEREKRAVLRGQREPRGQYENSAGSSATHFPSSSPPTRLNIGVFPFFLFPMLVNSTMNTYTHNNNQRTSIVPPEGAGGLVGVGR